MIYPSKGGTAASRLRSPSCRFFSPFILPAAMNRYISHPPFPGAGAVRTPAFLMPKTKKDRHQPASRYKLLFCQKSPNILHFQSAIPLKSQHIPPGTPPVPFLSSHFFFPAAVKNLTPLIYSFFSSQNVACTSCPRLV